MVKFSFHWAGVQKVRSRRKNGEFGRSTWWGSLWFGGCTTWRSGQPARQLCLREKQADFAGSAKRGSVSEEPAPQVRGKDLCSLFPIGANLISYLWKMFVRRLYREPCFLRLQVESILLKEWNCLFFLNFPGKPQFIFHKMYTITKVILTKHISSKALLLLHVVLQGCLISRLFPQPLLLSLLSLLVASIQVPISGNTVFRVEGPQVTLRGGSPSRFCDDIFYFYLLFHAVFVSKQLLDSVFDGAGCSEDFLPGLLRDH